MHAGVLVPIKGFGRAKGRLAELLDEPQRAALARRLAAGVLRAARPLPAWVVCDDEDVAAFAVEHGASVLWYAAHGLNDAVTHAVAALAAEGLDRVVVAHGDLALARELAWVADFDGITLVPDRHEDGTNVLCLPTTVGFEFRYGPGSFAAHLQQCRDRALPHRIVRDPALAVDIDTPADLATFEEWTYPANPR